MLSAGVWRGACDQLPRRRGAGGGGRASHHLGPHRAWSFSEPRFPRSRQPVGTPGVTVTEFAYTLLPRPVDTRLPSASGAETSSPPKLVLRGLLRAWKRDPQSRHRGLPAARPEGGWELPGIGAGPRPLASSPLRPRGAILTVLQLGSSS